VKLGGGNIIKSLNEIEISCLPKDLPEYIEVDMLDIELGGSIHLSDITLPEEVISVALSHGDESDLTVASVQAPRGIAEEEEEEAIAEGEGEEAETEEEASKSEEADSDDSGGDGEK
jgi:large subunit ribosomal protein L25